MKILIGTPLHDGTVQIEFMRSIMRLIEALRGRGIVFGLATPMGSLIFLQRNTLASVVLHDPTFDALLFIDSDMEFRPALIEKMIAAAKPVVGVICPAKVLDAREFHANAKLTGSPQDALERSLSFVGENYLMHEPIADFERPERAYKVRGGLMRTTRVGTGIMLIRRSVLETMRTTLPGMWLGHTPKSYARFGAPPGGVLQCFAQERDIDGSYLGEDYGFCDRWVRDCGGEIWACVDEPVGHIGRMAYRGTALSKLAATRTLLTE
ncbi:hypothetical protein [Methylobacterium trifolii]|uniref:Glycosyltransferase n=1 Tax=Methylobacterium trifolii TaxID=1003092 RepID=A0ABQ4TVM1_9HYPH|nr:hypothetical protein [Methylobacterium trifolii]GJE58758.1 hypothetical protein MPOCJGCO_0841 [Methylobacterium trifolii]